MNVAQANRAPERSPSDQPAFERDRRGTIRSLIESFVSLFVAVLLFRTFATEGYMISTGSMAPSLLGYHKRVECPRCGATFPFGVAYDTDEEQDAEALEQERSRAVCPNCKQAGIDVSDVPRNHGDQLLVNKQAYLFGLPRRWEVAVFRNPANALEAYVKRIVGLPGEALQIVDGDVLIDGRIARKTYEQQVAMRILVHDHDHCPPEENGYRPHWQSVRAEAIDTKGDSVGWQAEGTSFRLNDGGETRPDRAPFQWVEYRHQVRSGGVHESSVPLAAWPADLQPSAVPPIGLRYDSKSAMLSLTGALSEKTAQKLLELSQFEPFHDAVRSLYEVSHEAPLSDDYGYNPAERGAVPNSIRDVLMSAQIEFLGTSGEFAIQLTDGAQDFTVLFDATERQVRLFAGNKDEPVTTGDWPGTLTQKATVMEVSSIDQQIVVAVDGRPVMPRYEYATPAGTPAPRSLVRFGGRGADVRVSHIKLYRDVYYTSSRCRHGVTRPYKLKDDEYFVLGDNSPLSHDSRRWDDAPISESHLLGKPFLVHLPSKPGRLRVSNHEMHLRLPDFERVRFLK